MSSEWRTDLRLELESLVDRYVVQGADHDDVLNAVRERVEELQKSRDLDPDPAEDGPLVHEPANDWPGAT